MNGRQRLQAGNETCPAHELGVPAIVHRAWRLWHHKPDPWRAAASDESKTEIAKVAAEPL